MTIQFNHVTDTISTSSSNVTFSTKSVIVNSNLVVNSNTLFVDKINSKVGIGTSTPADALSVQGNFSASGYIFNDSYGGISLNGLSAGFWFNTLSTKYSGIYSPDGTGLVFRIANNDSRFKIDSSGNVGIGTSSISTGDKLSVYGGNIRVGTSGYGIAFPDGTIQTSAFSSAAGVTSFQTSLSGITPSTITTGAITLAGTLGVGNGGTGGTNTVLVANAGAPSFSSTPLLTSLTTTGTVNVGSSAIVNSLTSNTAITAGTGLTVTSGGANITGNVTISGSVSIGGNISVNASNVLVTDEPIIYVGENNQANLWDLGVVGSYTTNRYRHTGFVRNQTDGVWTIFDNLITEPSQTINWSQDQLNYGSFKTGNINVASNTNSDSTTTGALITAGGVGIAGNLNVGGTVSTFTSSVGIGTTRPSFPLDVTGYNVIGRFRTNTGTIANDAGVILQGIGSATQSTRQAGLILDPNGVDGVGSDYFQLYMTGDGAVNFTGPSSSLSNRTMSFQVAGSERMHIDSNGNVGIGTSNPQSPLHVIGNITAGNIIVTGDLTVQGTVYETSDFSLKTNIETIQSSVDTISNIRGVNFDWISSGKHSSGVIAQEIEAVLPHLVNLNDDGIKTVNYSGLIGVLIEAIKELKTEINQLKQDKN